MVIGIIVLHLPPYQPIGELGSSFFDFIKAFFSYAVFRATVPVLTVMSGFLVFRSSLKSNPLRLLAKKTSSILVPLIIWNIPIVIIIYMVQRNNILAQDFSVKLYPFETLNWINALTGLLDAPANYPLNFLRDLFAVSLLSPIYWLFLKKTPYLGLVAVLIIYYFELDGSFVLRNSMLVSFYIGGLAVSQNWTLTYLDRYARRLCLIFVSLCILIVVFNIKNRELFILLSPFFVWPSLSLITNTKLGVFLFKNSSSSFFTFLAHGPIITGLWLVFQRIPIEIPYFVYWFLTPPITVYLTILFSGYFKRLFPAISSIALGGR
jgi:succinoglycan biosynthesis protein ExoH